MKKFGIMASAGSPIAAAVLLTMSAQDCKDGDGETFLHQVALSHACFFVEKHDDMYVMVPAS